MQEGYQELVITPSAYKEHFSDFLDSSVDVGFEETENGFIVRSEDELDTLAWGLEQYAKALSEALNEDVTVITEILQKKNEDWISKYQDGI